MPTLESLLTVPQVAKLLGLAPRTVWRMVSEGRTPQTIRVGRFVRFKASEVNDWVKAGCPNQATWLAMSDASEENLNARTNANDRR